MLKNLKATIVVLLIVCNTVFWFPFLFIAAMIKLLMPFKFARLVLSKVCNAIAEVWTSFNSLLFDVVGHTQFTVIGAENLRRDQWYFVSCNHQSWSDIPVMQKVLNRKIPFLKFFLKQQLIWVPLLGICWWALDLPFMKRYSKAQIAAKPELAGKDLETTRKACEKFKTMPVTIFNFLEGTRFTPEKHAKNPEFKHLLAPKAGGLAFTLSSMGEKMNTMLDATIIYPKGNNSIWALCRGDIQHVTVHIKERIIPAEMFNGDYQNDPVFKARFQAWVNELWMEKDELIGTLVSKD